MSKVLVVATSEKCPAASALKAEAIPFDLVLVEDEYTYGRTLHAYWEKGIGFINIEHDIVPWPGAISRLEECQEDFCGHDYPVGHAGVYPGTLGMIRFSAFFIADHRDQNIGWDETKWNNLDAAVFHGLPAFHIHQPPVAHITDWGAYGN